MNYCSPCHRKIALWLALIGILGVASSLNAQSVSGLPFDLHPNAYSISLTESFDIDGLSFTPNDATFSWNPNAQEYRLFGTVEVGIENATIALSLGDVDNPGITFRSNGQLKHFSVSVKESFNLNSLPFNLGGQHVPMLSYDIINQQFEFTGSIAIDLDGNTVDVGLGTDADPGIIVKQGVLDHILLHVSANFDIEGLPLTDPDLTLQWDKENSTQTYMAYGILGVEFDNQRFTASLGSPDAPGLIFTNGKLEFIELNIQAGVMLFDALSTEDDFTLTFDKTERIFSLTGDILVGISLGSLEPTVYINADPDAGSGIVYRKDTKKLHVDNATFGMTGFELGGFELKDLSVTVVNNTPETILGAAVVPPGVEVDATLGFTTSGAFAINSVQLAWEAENVGNAVPIGETGLNLISLSGGLQNLNQPSKIVFQGSMGFIYGELIEIEFPGEGKKEVAIAYFETGVIISSHQLELETIADLGAADEDGEWVGYLGSADITATFLWGVEYSLEGTFNMLRSPLDVVEAKAEAHLYQSGDLDAFAEVKLKVPHSIPIIGGKTFEKVDGAIRYKSGQPNESYAAGWFRLNLGFTHLHLGAKVNLGNGHISKIGAGAEREITQQVENDAPSSSQPTIRDCIAHHTFTLDVTRPPAYLQGHLEIVNPNKISGWVSENAQREVWIRIYDPSGKSLQIFPINPSAPGVVPVVSNNPNRAIVIDMGQTDSTSMIGVSPEAQAYNSAGEIVEPDVALTPGQYHVSVEAFCHANSPLVEDDISFSVSPVYPSPIIRDFYTRGPNFAGDQTLVYCQVNTYLTDSVSLSFYWNTAPNHQGNVIQHYKNIGGNIINPTTGEGGIGVGFYPGILTQDTIWYYAVVDDGTNPPVYSDLIPVVYNQFEPHIIGTVLNDNDVPIENVIVVLENDSKPITTSTDANGKFSFYNMPGGAYTVTLDAYAPENLYWEVDGNDNAVTSTAIKTPDWAQMSLQVNEQPINTTLRLSSKNHNIFGSAYSNNPLSLGKSEEGISVILKDATGHIVAHATTTKKGYSFKNLPTGVYDLIFQIPSDPSFNFHWKSVDLNADNMFAHQIKGVVYTGNPTREDAMLKTGKSGLAFSIRNNQTLKGIGNVTVTLKAQDGSKTLRAVTNDEGLAVFQQGFTHQAYNITYGLPIGYTLDSTATITNVVFWNGNPTTITIRAKTNSVVGSVKLENADGAHIEGVTVLLLDKNGSTIASTTTTDMGYELPNIASGDYDLAFNLGFNSPYHWDPVDLVNASIPRVRIEPITVTGNTLNEYNVFAKNGAHGPAFYVQEIITGQNLIAGAIIMLSQGENSFNATTNAQGLAVFSPNDIQQNISYNFNISLPAGYILNSTNPPISGNTFTWNGTNSDISIFVTKQ